MRYEIKKYVVAESIEEAIKREVKVAVDSIEAMDYEEETHEYKIGYDSR